MKKLFYTLLSLVVFTTVGFAQTSIKNKKTQTVAIDGPRQFKQNIEKAAYSKGVSELLWDAATQTAQLSYDSTQTSSSAVLKKIALAGFDNESYLAPTQSYNNLPKDAQYTRNRKPQTRIKKAPTETAPKSNLVQTSEINQLIAQYMNVKNAFIQSDIKGVQSQALLLNNSIKSLKSNQLKEKEKTAWIKNAKPLNELTTQLIQSDDLTAARLLFKELSKTFKEFLSEFPLETPVYSMHCPMYLNGKGADWLSNSKEIENPYYGQQMLSCGSVVETLK